MVAKNENSIFFSKYMSSTQYQLWYNQISNFCRFSNECRWFVRKNRNFHGKYPKICKILVILCSHMVIFKVPGEAKPLENQIFTFCKTCHVPKCSARSVVSENASINWCNWWQTEKSKMASKMVAKVENSVYSEYESQSLPIAINPTVFMFSMQRQWILMKCIHFSSYLPFNGWLNRHFAPIGLILRASNKINFRVPNIIRLFFVGLFILLNLSHIRHILYDIMCHIFHHKLTIYLPLSYPTPYLHIDFINIKALFWLRCMQNMHLLHALILMYCKWILYYLVKCLKCWRAMKFNMASNMATKIKKYILIH